MVNMRYNKVRPVARANAPDEETTTRGRGRGRGRGRASGRGSERVVLFENEVPNDYVLLNDNPSVHKDEMKEELKFENVEAVENEEGGKDEAT